MSKTISIKQRISALADLFKVDESVISDRLHKILDGNRLDNIPKENREKTAITILYGEFQKTVNQSKTTEVLIRVEEKEDPTEFTNKKTGKKGYRSTVFVVVKPENSDAFFTDMTLWNDANEINPILESGLTYKTSVIIRGTSVSMNKREDIKEVDIDLPEAKDIITDNFTVVPVDDCQNNISDDYNDLKLIKGTVVSGWTKELDSGKTMGFLKLMADDYETTIMVKFSKMVDQVSLYDTGSEVYVLSQITDVVYDDDGEEKYPLGAWGTLIIPITRVAPEIKEDDDTGHGAGYELPDEDDMEDFMDGIDDDEDWG